MTRTAFVAVLLLLSPPGARGAEPPIAYETHIRPILKAHCFHCHGEAGEREGGLDVRLRRLIIEGGDSGAAIVAGVPDESLLLARVQLGEMPPAEDKRLSAEEVATIRAWITEGAGTLRDEPDTLDGPLFTAEEKNYWAFRPIQRPEVPAVVNATVARSPIDMFLLARLEAASADLPNSASSTPWGFAPDGDRRRLLRRASFDLLGLPPTPAALDEFDSDPAPDAWPRALDRLLASPHYGERWGRHWLDLAGYADSEGYTDEDPVRTDAFHYRDYVIRSFNRDKPFDRFIQEQLAGDEMITPPYENLQPEAIEKLVATGFLRMAPDGTASGGIEQGEARNQVVADTLQIVSTSLLGLTVHCAQCHDHRYDPIPQTDYYRLRAVFEPALDWRKWRVPAARRVSLYTDADRQRAEQIEAEAKEIDEQRLAKAEQYITRTLEEELLLVEPAADLASDAAEVRDALRTAYRTPAKERTEQQTALLKEHPTVASISVGSLYLYDRRRDERARMLDLERVAKEKRFLAETIQAERDRAPVEQRTALDQAARTPADQRTAEQQSLLESFPAVLATAETLMQFNPEAAAELERDKQTAAELRASKAADDLKRYADQAAELRASKPREDFLRATTEVPGVVPETYLFHRGDHDQPRGSVLPGDLSVLNNSTEFPANDPALPTTGRRLAYARHLTNGQHPLVARVLANRIWLHHFGQGLVDSPADFGVLGQRPTHPELLDWLAAELVSSGWSAKHLHRLIMNSTVYQQSAQGDPRIHEADPDNHLYGRFPLRRLEAEVVRDAMLAASGALVAKQFGDPVPVMEDEVGQIVLGIENLDGERKPTAPIALHGEEHRRSIYVQVRRSRTLSMLEAFDAAQVTPNCERRDASTVAPQSLMLMNSQFAVEYAERFAMRLLAESGDDVREQVRRGWEIAFGIAPTDEQVAAATSHIEQQRAALRSQAADADEATVVHQALAAYCQALFSANRFLYVE